MAAGSLDAVADSRALDSHPGHQPLAVGIIDSKSISNDSVEVFDFSASHSHRHHLVDLQCCPFNLYVGPVGMDRVPCSVDWLHAVATV